MYEQPNLLSRLKDRELLDLDQQPSIQPSNLLPQRTKQQPHRQPLNPQPPSLLTRMRNPATLQGLYLNQSQGPTATYSSNVTPLSNPIERGRSLRRQHTSRSSSNSSKLSEMTEQEQMRRLDRSLQRSKATIQRLERRSRKGERSSRRSAPPALLFRIQMGTSRMRSQSPKRPKLTSQHTHGYRVGRTNEPSCETLLQRLSSSSKFTPSIQRQQNIPSLTNQTAQSFRIQSGRTSSPAERSISTQSSVGNSPPHTMIPRSRKSEISRSLSGPSSPRSWSRTEGTGQSPGIGQSERPCSLSPIGYRNSPSMENTSSTYFPSPIQVSTTESLHSTKPSVRESGVSGISNYRTLRNMPISKSRTWTRLGYQSSPGRQKMIADEKGNVERIGRRMNPVTNGMTGSVLKRKRIAEDCMFATSVNRKDTKERIVESEVMMKRPRYMERSVWTDADSAPLFSPTACCTLSDEPLPRPPLRELSNHDAYEDHP